MVKTRAEPRGAVNLIDRNIIPIIPHNIKPTNELCQLFHITDQLGQKMRRRCEIKALLMFEL